jgi:CRISPR-associated endoribonuclease Cas6
MTTGWCERIRAQSRWFRPLDELSWRAASAARLDALAARLADPPLTLAPPELAALFEMDWVTIVGRRPDGLQGYPELAVRLRGAFGRILREFGPPILHRHDPAARPRAFDVLFQPLLAPGMVEKIAKPIVVHADVIGERLIARAGLIGMAGFWQPDAAAALLGALEGGVSLWEDGKFKVSINCIDASQERFAGFEPPVFPVREARLFFRTPLRLRSGDALVPGGASFLIALANRVARVAPWQLARLAIDWDMIHAQAHRLDCHMSDLLPYRWTRGTKRARRRLSVAGLLGKMTIRGPLDAWVPLLQIASQVNIGSHAAIGLGRFDLTLLP